MSEQKDRKLRQVAIAEYRYRHEADFAGGFLSEAGIPYRLQTDDAGGAELGLSALRPSVLWVRAVDAEAARAVLAHEVFEEPEIPDWEAEAAGLPWKEAEQEVFAEPSLDPPIAEPFVRRSTPSEPPGAATLGTAGRAAALVAGVASLLAMSLLPATLPWLLRAGLPVAMGVLLLGAAALGRAPGALARLLRGLTGGAP